MSLPIEDELCLLTRDQSFPLFLPRSLGLPLNNHTLLCTPTYCIDALGGRSLLTLRMFICGLYLMLSGSP